MARLVIAKAVWYRPMHASGSWDGILKCQSWFRSLSFTFGKCVRHLLYGHRVRPSFLIRFAIRWWPWWRLLSCQRLDLCKIAEWLTTSCCSRNHRDSQSPDWYWHVSRLSMCIYRGNFKLDSPFESFDQQWIRQDGALAGESTKVKPPRSDRRTRPLVKLWFGFKFSKMQSFGFPVIHLPTCRECIRKCFGLSASPVPGHGDRRLDE